MNRINITPLPILQPAIHKTEIYVWRMAAFVLEAAPHNLDVSIAASGREQS